MAEMASTPSESCHLCWWEGLTGFVYLPIVSRVDGCSCAKCHQSSLVAENASLLAVIPCPMSLNYNSSHLGIPHGP